MLSRIIRGPKAHSVARFAWPASGVEARIPTVAGRELPREDLLAGRIAELQAQLEKRVAEARQAGLREGEAAGRNQAAALVQPVMDRLARSIEDLASLRPKLMRDAEGELVELSLAIARRVLWREVSIDPGALQGLVKAALEKLTAQEVCRVRVHGELEAALRRTLDQVGRPGLTVFGDASLARGAVLFETARGTLDASLETQLAEIGRGLADRLER